jgi:hypothetical protein
MKVHIFRNKQGTSGECRLCGWWWRSLMHRGLAW